MNKKSRDRLARSLKLNAYKSPATPQLADILGKPVAELDVMWKGMGEMNDMLIEMTDSYGKALTAGEYREKAAQVAMTHYFPRLSNSTAKAVLVFMWLMKHQRKMMQPVLDSPFTYLDLEWAVSKGTREALEVVLRGKIAPFDR